WRAGIWAGCGSRWPGGRHLSTFATKTSSRVMPIPASSFPSSCPAAPTNGTPCLSSWNPGASPTNISSAVAEPEPNTTWVRPFERGHLVQPATSSLYAARLSASVAATAASTAASPSSASTEAGLDAAAVGREDRELLLHLGLPAVGAGRRLIVADELLEVRFAAHADVLVDRHRQQVTRRGSWASSRTASDILWSPGIREELERTDGDSDEDRGAAAAGGALAPGGRGRSRADDGRPPRGPCCALRAGPGRVRHRRREPVRQPGAVLRPGRLPRLRPRLRRGHRTRGRR